MVAAKQHEDVVAAAVVIVDRVQRLVQVAGEVEQVFEREDPLDVGRVWIGSSAANCWTLSSLQSCAGPALGGVPEGSAGKPAQASAKSGLVSSISTKCHCCVAV